MTMQVAMVGTDGIVLAGDTKWSWSNDPIRWSQKASKMVIDRERGIAISCARNLETARPIAEAIIGLPEKDWEYPILPIQRAAASIIETTRFRRDAQCLIVRTTSTSYFFRFQVATVNGEPDQPICHKIEDKAVVGDNNNAAIFWMERYYEKRPVNQLIPLAAHLVISSARLNSATISGLEVVVCSDSGISYLSDESLDELTSSANKLDRLVMRSLAKMEKQFTYAPNVVV
ncbi:MAG: hypothetical protein WBS19_05150 [Candidatus Korobacteraceae bacterium]